jgi:hypothetical protein
VIRDECVYFRFADDEPLAAWPLAGELEQLPLGARPILAAESNRVPGGTLEAPHEAPATSRGQAPRYRKDDQRRKAASAP